MEAWGSWTFSGENENLLEEVLKKFATDQCNLDKPIKDVLSSLAASSKVCLTIFIYMFIGAHISNEWWFLIKVYFIDVRRIRL